MLSVTVILLFSVSFVLLQQFTQAATLDVVAIPTDGDRVCPVQEKRDEVIQNITADILNILRDGSLTRNCGQGLWYQVAYLNMSDPTQQCPSAWREYNSNGIRTCRRPDNSSGSCSGISFTRGRQYSKVCGRAIGYQYGVTDAFYRSETYNTIDSYYVYGVSFTYGTPRNHIWTLAAGWSEIGSNPFNCPCANPSNPGNSVVPLFISDNYYCESGNPTSSLSDNFYSSDPLWDGEQCEGECCSNGKSPPWFGVQLPNTTTDDIEVRICIPQGSFGDPDVVIEVLEIYVQ